ncbi:MAG: hypothetical protein LBO05_00555, partial [Deltaproteobacteria bacterium]|nr:hypothetical protein [Deltaproteobacteria bacterium]
QLHFLSPKHTQKTFYSRPGPMHKRREDIVVEASLYGSASKNQTRQGPKKSRGPGQGDVPWSGSAAKIRPA